MVFDDLKLINIETVISLLTIIIILDTWINWNDLVRGINQNMRFLTLYFLNGN